MPRPTKQAPDSGDARTRLLLAATDLIRSKGFAATSVDGLCQRAEVTKGAFFHHFASKEALGVAVAENWRDTTGAFFASAPYHAPEDPLQRILAYIAFRKAIISEDLPACTCLAGTLVQETYATSDAIRRACAEAMFGHTATLEDDFAQAIAAHGTIGITAQSLAQYTQTVLQGAFVMAKAAQDPDPAHAALDHLYCYIRLLFSQSKGVNAP